MYTEIFHRRQHKKLKPKIFPPTEWNTVLSVLGISSEDFVTYDDWVMTAGTLSDDEILD